MSRSLGLAGRLADHLPPHAVRAPGLSRDHVDRVGRLVVRSATTADLRMDDTVGKVEIDSATRRFAEGNPDALWVVDLRARDEAGTLTPFRPPRVERLDVAVPLRVSQSVLEKLREHRLPTASDLLTAAALPLRDERVAILGMRTLAALDALDARRVTWWLPSGAALELVVEEGPGGVALVLEDVVSAGDAAKANCGPNVLVALGRQAALLPDAETRPEGALPGPPRAAVPVFFPPRSSLFDAWARYTQLVREEQVDREKARMAHAIAYRDATQDKAGWRAHATLSPEALEAWLGPDAPEGRRLEVGQPCALTRGEEELGRVTLEEVVRVGPGELRLKLKTERGTTSVPPTGTLAAREDRGAKVKLDREREALDRLTKGAAGCDRLSLLLASPENALPPDAGRLDPAPSVPLDPHQAAAVQMIVGCRDLVAIQGPPGTGKTGVIAESLRQMAAKGRRAGRTYRVLVSSVQNQAITNVMERLAGVEGVLVHLVERAARDEEEALDFARRMERQRDRVVAGLEKRLERSDVAGRLARLREAHDQVDDLKSLAAAGPAGRPALTRGLRALAEQPEGYLPSWLREEAAQIAAVLEAPPAPTAGVRVRPPPPPDMPEAVPAWWDAAGPSWPAEHLAAVSAEVRALVDALAIENPVRRNLQLPRIIARLRAAVAATEWAPDAGPAPVVSVDERLDAWLASALREIRALREGVSQRPEAIALGFLQALREDPRAWARIVERHGNTVAATCSMAAKTWPDPGQGYDWVIVDEAGRATPFELLIPMVQGERVVLIGDHRQLPPMVDTAIARRASDEDGARLDLDATLFGRLFELLPKTNAVRLAVQYRMHEAIGGLVDEVFYRPNGEALTSHFAGGRVSAAWCVRERGPDGQEILGGPLSRGAFGDAPLVWVDVAPPPGRSCDEHNPAEARRVVALLDAYAKAGVRRGEIAVICPYTRQRKAIDALLHDFPAAKGIAELQTIDAVQGREYGIVLLCLVRTDGRPGFLASPNRLNVAVSRAQRQLVIVGCSRAFLDSPRVRERAPELVRVIAHVRRSSPPDTSSPERAR